MRGRIAPVPRIHLLLEQQWIVPNVLNSPLGLTIGSSADELEARRGHVAVPVDCSDNIVLLSDNVVDVVVHDFYIAGQDALEEMSLTTNWPTNDLVVQVLLQRGQQLMTSYRSKSWDYYNCCRRSRYANSFHSLWGQHLNVNEDMCTCFRLCYGFDRNALFGHYPSPNAVENQKIANNDSHPARAAAMLDRTR
jgi:hypothetical protein